MYSQQIDKRHMPLAWPIIERWVEAAVRKAQSDQSPEEIRWMLSQGQMRLFLACEDSKVQGCWILEFTHTHRGDMCNIYLCAGRDFKRWHHLMADIKAYARSMGCSLLQAAGRPGWQRALAPDGFKKLRVILETRLDDAQQQR